MYQGRYWNDRMFDVADAVVELAREDGCTPAQMAVAWLLAQPGVTAPIIGASRPDQLVETTKAVGLKLSEATLQRLDQVSQPFR
jgi:aryl-alcohol dehydrogenase-like predicted oxidoreductase